VACGLRQGPAPGRHLVGLALLSLLSEEAADGVIFVCVDDAQWLDRESVDAIGFMARRMHADAIAILLAFRTDTGDVKALDGLPVMELRGLEVEPALELLRAAAPGTTDPRIARRIVLATGGNPLALTELGKELSTPQLVGEVLVPEPIPLGRRLEAHYKGLVLALPPESQTWLLVAAAEPAGDLGYITDAARSLGVAQDASAAAEAAGLVSIRAGVIFRHPLTRSAIYGGATDVDRRHAHESLAAVTTRGSDIDRRAWHLATATVGVDESVASLLEQSARRAAERGGYAARARFLVRAGELTPDPNVRQGRMLSAAEAALFAGSARQADALVTALDPDTLVGEPLGRAQMVLAETPLALGEPGGPSRAPARCLAAAAAFGPGPRARDALLCACEKAVSAEALVEGTDVAAIAKAARGETADGGGGAPATAAELQLVAFSTLVLDGYEAAVEPIRDALAELLDPATPGEDVLAHFVLGVTLATVTWDDVARTRLLDRVAEDARRTGALWELDSILYCAAMAETTLGNLDAGDAYLAEGEQLRMVIGSTTDLSYIYRHPELVAWHADDDDTVRAVLAGTAQAAATLGFGAVVAIADIGSVILDMGRGRYAEALALARRLVDGDQVGVHTRVLPEVVEAASRAGDRLTAAKALGTLETRALASGTPWALGLLARSRALLSRHDEAEEPYREAITVLATTRARSDLARAHLLYGEWLRRQKRRRDARTHLRQSLAYFDTVGAHAFAERARQELLATGEAPTAALDATETRLTPQERTIARLARDGGTNAEIAARLFISASTVDYHLRKIFRKLGISSRRDLRTALPD